MNINLRALLLCALLGGCAANSTDEAAPVAVVPTVAPVVVATPRPSPTKSIFIGATPTPFPTLAPAPKPTPTPTPFKTKPAKGFSEAERRSIFREIVEAEDQGVADAEKKFPDVSTMDYLDEVNRLQAKYKSQVVRRYRLSEEQTSAISNEGVENRWPPLNE